MTQSLRKLIFVGCRELGIDTDTRKALQLQLVGKESLSDMDEQELRTIKDHLVQQGFKPASKGRYKPAPRKDLRLVHVLWAKLGAAGELDNPTRKGLNAFVRRKFGDAWGSVPVDVDQLRDHKQIDAVLQALIAWARRAGVEIDWERIGK